jgi:hypothetical protein
MNREELRNQFQADLRKFRKSTIERKQMSTKTTFKRIALVAVAALGLGVLSVAPSSADVSNVTVSVANGTSSLTGGAASDSSTAAVITVNALFDTVGVAGNVSKDTVTVTFVQKSVPSTSAATARLYYSETTTPTGATRVDTGTTITAVPAAVQAPLTSADTARGVTAGGLMRITTEAAGYAGAKFFLQLDSSTGRTAGTYTYTIITKSYATGATSTPVTTTNTDVSIVVAALASASETPSSAYSAAYLAAVTTAPTADSATVSGVATAGTAAGYLGVLIRNASNGTAAVDTVTISLSGPGLITGGAISSATKYYRGVGLSGDNNYTISGDGTAGVATVTVSYELTKQTFTKSLTFYAANAKTITPSVRTPILKVGTNSGAASVTAVDANGNAWLGTAYVVASSAADALIAGSTTPAACSAWTATNGIRCDITGVSAGTAKLTVMDASTLAAAKATAEWTVTVSTATAAGVKVEFDKASYSPYEKATVTVSVVDAAGNLVPANTFSSLFAAGGISASQSFTGVSDTLTATSVTTEVASSSSTGAVALKKVYTVYMPAQGDVTLSWTGGTSLAVAGQVKGSTTASVVNSSVDAATDAANEATDAANAATDAALAAADAADAATAAAQVAKLVASLKAQITSLTNLVIKIQKKVKA